jgi:hypothetical protein
VSLGGPTVGFGVSAVVGGEVGDRVRMIDGISDGVADGNSESNIVGLTVAEVGNEVAAKVGKKVGWGVGKRLCGKLGKEEGGIGRVVGDWEVGNNVRRIEGEVVGFGVVDDVGLSVGDSVGYELGNDVSCGVSNGVSEVLNGGIGTWAGTGVGWKIDAAALGMFEGTFMEFMICWLRIRSQYFMSSMNIRSLLSTWGLAWEEWEGAIIATRIYFVIFIITLEKGLQIVSFPGFVDMCAAYHIPLAIPSFPWISPPALS